MHDFNDNEHNDSFDRFKDYVDEQWEFEHFIEHRQQVLKNNMHFQQKEITKLKLESAERDKDNAIQDIKRYLDNLTPRSCSELEALLTQLGITLHENDLTNIADLGKEYVNKTENFEKTAVDESAEQDLEKYLSKLTSEKREELEDILNRFREASAKLDELSEKANTKPAPNQLTTVQALICGGLVALIIIFYGIVCYLD